jgi:hypothetical protein
VAAVNEAFAAGDVKRALALTPDAVADRIMVAGTPDDRIEWLNTAYTPTGMTHALLSFADPFTLNTRAGLEVPGLPISLNRSASSASTSSRTSAEPLPLAPSAGRSPVGFSAGH